MNFAPVNVLANRNFGTPATIESVNAIVNAQGNRSQRREVLKALRKSENIRSWTEKEAQKRMQMELGDRADEDLIWMVATLADTLYEDYHWKESPDNDHGQITAFIERFVKRMNKYAEDGYSTRALCEMIEEKTGIVLVPNKSWRN
jgi:hypothetical protein